MPALPPLPKISSLDEELPQQSTPVVVATSSERLCLFANSDNSSRNAWISDIPGQKIPGSDAVLAKYWDDGPPRQYTLTLRHYWRQVPGSYTRVNPGDSFDQKVTITHGVSTTDTESLSAELGVQAGGLSAKVTATFEHSVSVTDEVSVEKTYAVDAPATGMVRVWLLWQLVDEIVALDSQGNVIPVSDGREGDVWWTFSSPFPYKSGAFLSYPNVQQAFPSENYVPAQADFPAEAS